MPAADPGREVRRRRGGRALRRLAMLALTVTALPDASADQPLREHGFDLGGHRRSYLAYVPPALPPGPRPLVVVVHGAGGSHYGMIKLTRGRFDQLAERDGFIVAYPKAVARMWDFGEGGPSETFTPRRDDLTYFRRMLDQLETDYPVDRQRIFVAGMSRGGKVAFMLGCRLGGRVRAIASVAMTLPHYLADDCTAGPALPLALIVGDADPIVPISGGPLRVGGEARGTVLSVDQTLALWRARHRCATSAARSEGRDREDDGTRLRRTEWIDCSEAPLVLYELLGAGHTWPSGLQYLPEDRIGKVAREVDGADEIWDFFARF
ncbi:MAG: hypothetical protein KDG52_13620 [Rhodocyclaceae bacterium]|nr:hypothetical protein [Rhodocyclaceae bacterium]